MQKYSEKIEKLSAIQFGTSGVRGRVSAMTDEVCWIYANSFIEYLKSRHAFSQGDSVAIAGDLRSSTPRILAAISSAITYAGGVPVYCGRIPTPALVFYGIKNSMPSLMVTGSHIPDDRNGIKFHTSCGEISKVDEQGIIKQEISIPQHLFDEEGALIDSPALAKIDDEAYTLYVQRYLDFFPAQFLSGKKIGLYEHSAVGRDILKEILKGLGASVVSLGRSEKFISVDTEAIRPEDIDLARQWSREYALDCIISTDGDSDRPLVSDEKGAWLRGDTLGVLTSVFLEADCVVTPISSNTALEKSNYFKKTIRTRIGSPYVIEAIINNDMHTVGYEANGGFILASPIFKGGRELNALPTRDATIVPLAILSLSIMHNKPISKLVDDLPSRYTFSDRLKNFPVELSQSILLSVKNDRSNFMHTEMLNRFPDLGDVIDINDIDGIRVTYESGDVLHLRPSGNAPELRCYTESNSKERALELNQHCIKLAQRLA